MYVVPALYSQTNSCCTFLMRPVPCSIRIIYVFAQHPDGRSSVSYTLRYPAVNSTIFLVNPPISKLGPCLNCESSMTSLPTRDTVLGSEPATKYQGKNQLRSYHFPSPTSLPLLLESHTNVNLDQVLVNICLVVSENVWHIVLALQDDKWELVKK